MRRLFSGIVLLFSVLLANTALGYYGGSNRQVAEFDTDWIWVGGEILPGNTDAENVKIVLTNDSKFNLEP